MFFVLFPHSRVLSQSTLSPLLLPSCSELWQSVPLPLQHSSAINQTRAIVHSHPSPMVTSVLAQGHPSPHVLNVALDRFDKFDDAHALWKGKQIQNVIETSIH